MDRPFKWAIFNTLAASSERAPYILSPLCGRGWGGKLLLLAVSTKTYCLSPCQLFSLNKSRWMLVMKTCGGLGQPVRGANSISCTIPIYAKCYIFPLLVQLFSPECHESFHHSMFLLLERGSREGG